MKKQTGTVTSSKMPKTATVRVDRQWRHPIYQKTVKRSKKYLVHDEIGVKVGEVVVISETRPISKRKRWQIAKVQKKPAAAKKQTKK